MDPKAVEAAREKLKAKMGAPRLGGKGTVRRKVKTVHKAASMDDKRLQGTLKRLGVNQIPGIEEVNLFKDDGSVIHFENPKVQASLQANTYVVSGTAENKSMQEMLPTILSQMGNNGIKLLTEQLAKGNFGNLGGLAGGLGGGATSGGDDEEMPALEGNFDDAAK